MRLRPQTAASSRFGFFIIDEMFITALLYCSCYFLSGVVTSFEPLRPAMPEVCRARPLHLSTNGN